MAGMGYIRLSRRFFDTEEWAQPRKFSKAEAWLDLIAMASYADRKVSIDDKGRKVELLRGEIIASQRFLAKRWGWGLGSVNRYLDAMASGADPRIKIAPRKIMIEIGAGTPSGTPSGTLVDVITLCKYDVYNEGAEQAGTDGGTPSGTRSGTKIKKDMIKKDSCEAHTQLSELLKSFSHACRSAEARAIAATRDMAIAFGKIEPTTDNLAKWDAFDPACRLLVWVWQNFERLQTAFEQPLIYWQARQMLRMYEFEDVARIVEAMANKRDASSSNKSFFWTFKAWASRDYRIVRKAELGNPRYANFVKN